MASPTASRPASPTPSQLPPVPSSPVYSVASTANPLSAFNLPNPPAPRPAHAVLTKADLEKSQEAYSELLSSAKSYRLALAALSSAASTFGSALESCARLKEARAEPIGPPSSRALGAVGGASAAGGSISMTASFTTAKGACTADTLLSASGLHQLVANHQQILSETVYRAFEVPLLHDLDRWQAVIDDEEQTYQRTARAQAKEIKKLEKDGMRLHRQRKRDVGRFRAHLVELTAKLDGLTTLHADHARTMLRESQETSARVVEASCSLVRAEVDIYEGLARKGWSGGGLEDLLEKGQDLFASHDDGVRGPGAAGGPDTKLFSILPPKSILADSSSEPGGGGGGGIGHHHARSDSLLMEADRYQSLTAVAADSDSVFSADFNKPRGARPFSPQPIRRIPADVDALGVLGEMSSSAEQQARQQDGETTPPGVKDKENKDEADESSRNSEQQAKRDSDQIESPRGRSSPEFITDESSPDR